MKDDFLFRQLKTPVQTKLEHAEIAKQDIQDSQEH